MRFSCSLDDLLFIRKRLLCRQCIERCHMAGTIALHLYREFRNLRKNTFLLYLIWLSIKK